MIVSKPAPVVSEGEEEEESGVEDTETSSGSSRDSDSDEGKYQYSSLLRYNNIINYYTCTGVLMLRLLLQILLSRLQPVTSR